MFFREDNTYQEIRENSMKQWLNDLAKSEDTVNRGGAKLTLEYMEYLNRKIKELEDKNKLKDEYLKKMKRKLVETKNQAIATVRTDFSSKFGIPRQSGLVEELRGTIVFEQEYRDANALRGLERYTHLWLIWQFSEMKHSKWSPTVKPPRLGGNERMGVFATRSPNRPNPLGLSLVTLKGIEHTKEYGPVIHIAGADLLDGTPIYDIKPYLPYVECRPDAIGGFSEQYSDYALNVEIPKELLEHIPEDKREVIRKVLAQDPRPSYQSDPTRIYGMEFADLEIKFTVEDHVLTVYSVGKREQGKHEVKFKENSKELRIDEGI